MRENGDDRAPAWQGRGETGKIGSDINPVPAEQQYLTLVGRPNYIDRSTERDGFFTARSDNEQS
jgi:hypothetical protein